jgi:hypothetical protein
LDFGWRSNLASLVDVTSIEAKPEPRKVWPERWKAQEMAAVSGGFMSNCVQTFDAGGSKTEKEKQALLSLARTWSHVALQSDPAGIVNYSPPTRSGLLVLIPTSERGGTYSAPADCV